MCDASARRFESHWHVSAQIIVRSETCAAAGMCVPDKFCMTCLYAAELARGQLCHTSRSDVLLIADSCNALLVFYKHS